MDRGREMPHAGSKRSFEDYDSDARGIVILSAIGTAAGRQSGAGTGAAA
jgi:hypothetical protein